MSPIVLREVVGAEAVVRVVRYAPHERMARHAHDEHGLSAVLDGELVEEAEHRTISATAGWVVSKPCGVYHANRFGPAGATLVAVSPTSEIARAVPRRWQWASNASVFRATLCLMNGGGEDALVDVVAALGGPAPTARETMWLRRVRDALDAGDRSPVSAMAREWGVHPVYLARAFRRHFGVSLREYRRQRQVRRALHLITTTPLPLAQVALDCGFTDHSHMCRAFRSVVGWNPSLLRG
jgi:AraC family transcriptional regulator